MFNKGQKVWCLIYGQGVVAEVDDENACGRYGIIVKFNDGLACYTADGKYHPQGVVTLFPHPVEVVKKTTKPSIDWSHVSSEFNYLVQDSDGEGYLCGEEPTCVESGWGSESHYVSATAFTSYEPGTCDWRDSLVKRPELVQEI